MIQKRKFLFVFIIALFISLYLAWSHFTTPHGKQQVTFTPAEKNCFVGESKVHPWKYCIHNPAGSLNNGDLAYFLHGRDEDEQTWSDATVYTGQIQQYWQDKKLPAPTVVSISFGPLWLISEKAASSATGLLEFFLTEVIPTIEKQTGKPKRRIVFGESMGGINSLELVFKTKGLFQKTAVLCPVILEQSPHDSVETIQKFLHATGADPKTIYSIMLIAKKIFPTEQEWNNFSPPRLVDKYEDPNAPEFYVSCGLTDKYGNYTTTETLAKKLVDKKYSVEWRPLYGGHCVVDIQSVAEFLVK